MSDIGFVVENYISLWSQVGLKVQSKLSAPNSCASTLNRFMLDLIDMVPYPAEHSNGVWPQQRSSLYFGPRYFIRAPAAVGKAQVIVISTETKIR